MRKIEVEQPCERCNGSGMIENCGKCIMCGGHGNIIVVKWVSNRDEGKLALSDSNEEKDSWS